MEVTVEDISRAISTWFKSDVIPKGNLLQQGIGTFILLQLEPRLVEVLKPLSLVSTDGKFNTTELRTNIVEAFRVMGGKYTIPILDYTVDNADINRILDLLGGLDEGH